MTVDLDEGTVFFHIAGKYSCHDKWPHKVWDVPEGTVLEIVVYPRRHMRIADLKLRAS
jgi:hypothetical protein